MQWPAERQTLEVLHATPAVNSSLRKKLAIINRLKNLSKECLPSVMEELRNENLSKFYVEIINSLLSNSRLQESHDIHNIVRVIYLYSADPAFIGVLTATVKKRCAESWMMGALFAEVYFLLHRRVDGIAKTLLQLYGAATLQMVDYLLSSFVGADTPYVRAKAEEFIDRVTDKNVAVLRSIAARLGWDIKLEVKVDYVELVKPSPCEFDFYVLDTSGPANPPMRAMGSGDVRLIDEERNNTRFLDALAVGIAGRPDLIAKVVRKGRVPALTPAVARVIAALPQGRKAVVAQLLGIGPEQLSTDELRLIGELYKFGIIAHSELVELNSALLKMKSINKLCALVESAGRRMLAQKETNRYARDLIESIRQASSTEVEKLVVDDCIGCIFQLGSFKASILGFFQWFFQASTFSASSLFDRMAEDKALLYILFSRPELFESAGLLATAITRAGMESAMVDFYLGTIVSFMGQSRQRGLAIAEALAVLMAPMSPQHQSATIDTVWKMRMELNMRFQTVLVLLARSSPSLHRHYISLLADQPASSECKFLLFNFCEQYNYSYSEESEADSFEQEMASLR